MLDQSTTGTSVAASDLFAQLYSFVEATKRTRPSRRGQYRWHCRHVQPRFANGVRPQAPLPQPLLAPESRLGATFAFTGEQAGAHRREPRMKRAVIQPTTRLSHISVGRMPDELYSASRWSTSFSSCSSRVGRRITHSPASPVSTPGPVGFSGSPGNAMGFTSVPQPPPARTMMQSKTRFPHRARQGHPGDRRPKMRRLTIRT